MYQKVLLKTFLDLIWIGAKTILKIEFYSLQICFMEMQSRTNCFDLPNLRSTLAKYNTSCMVHDHCDALMVKTFQKILQSFQFFKKYSFQNPIGGFMNSNYLCSICSK